MPAHLLARHTNGASTDIGQTLLARGLLPIKTYGPPGSELIARDDSQPLIVKRTPPPRQRVPATSIASKGKDLMKSVARSSALSTTIGAMGAGSMLGIGSVTNWHDHKEALGSTVGMACIGALALTAACAQRYHAKQYLAEAQTQRGRRGRNPNPAESAGRSARGAGPSTELETVPLSQGNPQAPHNAGIRDASDLVRRFVSN